MPVRHETPSQEPAVAERPGRSADRPPFKITRGLVLGTIIGVLLVAVIIAAIVQDKPANKKDTKGGPQGGGTTLPRGEVTFGAGGADDLFGMPIQYPRTITGGAAAALNESAASSSPLTANEASREALNNYIYTKAAAKKYAVTLAQANKERQENGLDENGQVVNDDGTVDAEATYLSSTTIPEYGVYRVMPGATTSRVAIEFWAPSIDGIARADRANDLQVTWGTVRVEVVWDRGDWRLTDGISLPKYQPEPASPGTINVSFAERASLFPAKDGWVMVKNATQSTSAFPNGVSK